MPADTPAEPDPDQPDPTQGPDGTPDAAAEDAESADGETAQAYLEAEEGMLRRPGGWSRWAVPVLAVAWSLFQLSSATWLTVDSLKLRAVHLSFAMAIAFLSFPAGKGAGRGRIGRLRRRTARGVLRGLKRAHLLGPIVVLRRVAVSVLGVWAIWHILLGAMVRAVWRQRADLPENIGYQLHKLWINVAGGTPGQPPAEPFDWAFSQEPGLVWLLVTAAILIIGCAWIRPRKNAIPLSDWMLAIAGALVASYIVIDYQGYVDRMGFANKRDLVVGITLVILLLEACRRTIGPALVLVVGCFMVYCIPGVSQNVFDALQWKGLSIERFIGQIARTPEGIYTTPLDVSAKVVFLFVLFGAMLERAGGGRFFIQLALSLLGGFRGGPAKAAVLSSGLTGLISGSSIANIVTTGTFTIPLMKEVGYPSKKAAAIEVAASTDGQLAPPVMGAAAFIIAEYLALPYRTVVYAAAVPALTSYCALFYITHLEACKLGLRGLPRVELPSFFGVVKAGWYFLIPLVILLYKLIFQGRSPENSAAWAIAAMAVIMLIQRPLLERWFAPKPDGQGQIAPTKPDGPGFGRQLWAGVVDIFVALAMGARNMVAVATACATAGIVVGIVGLGPGGKITSIVDHLSQGNVFLLLLVTAIACLIIGMGLPTTATYVIMAALLAPVIVNVGGSHGLLVLPLAAHLFVFYFGILADDTPPVGLAAYAAAAIAKSPPVPTGLQAFTYDIRTAILPFMFIFNTDLLLHTVTTDGTFELIKDPLTIAMVVVTAIGGNLCFAAATQGWFLTRMGKWGWIEIPLMLVATYALMRPDHLAQLAGQPHAQRYWFTLIGFAAVGLVALNQLRRRTPEDRGLTPATA